MFFLTLPKSQKSLAVLLIAEKKIAKLSIINNKNNCKRDLIHEHTKNDELKQLFFGFFKLLNSVF